MRFWLEVVDHSSWDGINEKFEILKSYDADYCDKHFYNPQKGPTRADAKWVLVKAIEIGSEPLGKGSNNLMILREAIHLALKQRNNLTARAILLNALDDTGSKPDENK